MGSYKENYDQIDWSVKAPRVLRKAEIPVKRSHLSAPMIIGDYKPYECPVTGRMVEGRQAHRENLKQTGCRILEPGEVSDVKKNGRKRLEEKIDRSVDMAVDAVAKDFI